MRLFVATLCYSLRIYVRAFRHERQSAWLAGLEGAFQHFGGVAEQVLCDYVRRHIIAYEQRRVAA